MKTLTTYIELLEAAGLLAALPVASVGDSPSAKEGAADFAGIAVHSISYDSRTVEPGCLFVAKGAHFEPRFLEDALSRGAVAVLAEVGFVSGEVAGHLARVATSIEAPAAASAWADSSDPTSASAHLPGSVPLIEVTDLRAALPLIANHYHDEVWRKLKTIGLTGTKGKSTTAYYIKSILDTWLAAQGKPPCGLLSSIDSFDGVISEESHITTPEVFELHQHFANAVASGIEYFVMEVSSQALKYGRTAGVTFKVGAFLNIGEDHISPIEHENFEDYFTAKLRLFKQCETAVVNLDTAEVERVLAAAEQAERLITFSRRALQAPPPGDLEPTLRATDIKPHTGGIDFTVTDARGTRSPQDDGVEQPFPSDYQLGMTGVFNVENALAALATARSLGVPEEHIRTGLLKGRAPGRMELILPEGGPVVLIDYAHNWMSFDELFASIATEYPGTRRSIVFGCPGYKALGRRRELGTLAGRFCDMTYLTEEDAGEEPVHQISEQIAAFVAAEGGAFRIIDDRELAIRTALLEADANTVVMITGKGRETRQKRGTEYIPVRSDLAIVNDFYGL